MSEALPQTLSFLDTIEINPDEKQPNSGQPLFAPQKVVITVQEQLDAFWKNSGDRDMRWCSDFLSPFEAIEIPSEILKFREALETFLAKKEVNDFFKLTEELSTIARDYEGYNRNTRINDSTQKAINIAFELENSRANLRKRFREIVMKYQKFIAANGNLSEIEKIHFLMERIDNIRKGYVQNKAKLLLAKPPKYTGRCFVIGTNFKGLEPTTRHDRSMRRPSPEHGGSI